MDEINLPKVSKFSKFFTLFFGLLLLILGIWFFSLPDESPCLMISFLKGIYAELFGLGLGVLIFQLLLKWLERRMAIKKESYKMSKSEDEAKAMKGLSNLRNGGWLSDGSLVGYDFNNIKWRNTNLDFSNLSSTDLNNSVLSGSSLGYANLENSNLYSAILSNAYLYGADLSNANLINTDFRGANMQGVKIIGADTTGMKYDDGTILPSGFDPEASGAEYVQDDQDLNIE